MMLNSKLNNFIYKIITQEEGRTFAEVKPQNVRKLFIPKIPKEQQKVFEILCDYLMFLNDDKNEPIFNHTPNNRVASNIDEVANMMTNELCFKEHMKTNDLDVLQFIQPKPIHELSDKKERAEIIMNFYLWLQTTDNKVRQRINSIDIKSPNILSIINIS